MLTDLQDAFGHHLYDYYSLEKERDKINCLIERGDGLINSDFAEGYFRSYKDWAPYEKKAIKHARGRVLDIGPGAGRHALYLQEKGHEVVGLDNSPLALEVCKQRGLKNTICMPFSKIHSGLGVFDTVIMMGNNFGLFGSYKGARRLLKKLRGMTSKKGRIITVTNDVYQTDIPENLSYQAYNRECGRMSGQIKMRVRYRKYASPWFDYLMVSKTEMEDVLEGTGWEVAKYINSETPVYATVLEKKKRQER
jgi:cyclopropane fatty-acyl-phospholipid synthase-like methyltransferase